MTLNDFINIANFLGEEMTEEQSTRLMDQARAELTTDEIEILAPNVVGCGDLYTQSREYMAEMGRF